MTFSTFRVPKSAIKVFAPSQISERRFPIEPVQGAEKGERGDGNVGESSVCFTPTITSK